MRYLLFDTETTEYPVALLVKSSGFNKPALQQHYLAEWVTHGISAQQVIGFTLMAARRVTNILLGYSEAQGD